MTPADRARLAALAEAATPGPWATVEFGALGQVVRVRRGVRCGIADTNCTADAAFIAASRTAVPDLLAALADAEAFGELLLDQVRLREIDCASAEVELADAETRILAYEEILETRREHARLADERLSEVERERDRLRERELSNAQESTRCTCDDFADESCLVHARENALQNEVLALRERVKLAEAWLEAEEASMSADRAYWYALEIASLEDKDAAQALLQSALRATGAAREAFRASASNGGE